MPWPSERPRTRAGRASSPRPSRHRARSSAHTTRNSRPARRGEPVEIGLPPAARRDFAREEVFRLLQHQRVRRARAAGLMTTGELVVVDPLVNVLPACFGERPLELLLLGSREEGAERATESAVATHG